MFRMEFSTGITGRSYVVEKKTDKHFAISFKEYNNERFITHRENSKQATKLAQLLAQTYAMGYWEGAY